MEENTNVTEQEVKKGNGKVVGIVAAIVVVLLLVAGLAYYFCAPKTSADAKTITIVVVDDSEAMTLYLVNTSAEYLSEVFDEVDDLSVEGYDTDYGLYITTVNGLYADYDADSAYWSIYVNGDYGMYGADSQPVTDGDEYKLVYTVYVAY